MRYISSIFLVIFALDMSAAAEKVSANKGVKKDSKVSVSATKSSETAEKGASAKTNQETEIEVQKAENLSSKEFVPNFVDLWEDNAKDFDEVFRSERQREVVDMDDALEILRNKIIYRRPDQKIDLYGVFSELRKVFTESQFSTEELMALIEDAVELKKKYLLIFDFVIRGEYARRAVQEGLNADEVLQFASSEYIQLPSFILKARVDNDQLNDVLTDLGCGMVWKDRVKYLFILNRYFGKTGAQAEAGESAVGSSHFPRRIRNYLRLLEEVDRFFGEAYEHLVYLIAQDFYYAEIPQEKIMKIFSFSEKEWSSLIEPIKSRNL